MPRSFLSSHNKNTVRRIRQSLFPSMPHYAENPLGRKMKQTKSSKTLACMLLLLLVFVPRDEMNRELQSE